MTCFYSAICLFWLLILAGSTSGSSPADSWSGRNTATAASFDDKRTPPYDARREYSHGDERRDNSLNSQSQQPPPPPPPAWQASSAHRPIHYSFQSVQRPATSRAAEDHLQPFDDDDIPWTHRPNDHDDLSIPVLESTTADTPKFASPRRDAMTRQLSTRRGRFVLKSACFVVGSGVGHFAAQSLFQKPQVPLVMLVATIFLAVSYLRNSFGELVRALGLALIWTVERSRRVRQDYPTWPHLKASIRLQPRVGFPVKLVKTKQNGFGNDDEILDVEFNQLYSLVAMSLVGAACGGSLPLIPTWMGALAGAASLGMTTSLDSARGDLARVMGARVVALVQEMLDINAELQVLSKLGVVSGKILDKILILDRKHGIRNRIVDGFNFMYAQVTNAMNNQGATTAASDNGRERPSSARQGRYSDERFDDDGPYRREHSQGDDYDEGSGAQYRRGQGPSFGKDYHDDR